MLFWKWRAAAEALGLPLVPPFLAKEANDFGGGGGANFAIVGGTALDVGFFIRHNNASVPPFQSSLRVQIGWFRSLLRRGGNATAAAAAERLATALFVVGEFGGSDYRYLLSGGKSLEQAKSFVPEVVRAICRGVEVTKTEKTQTPLPNVHCIFARMCRRRRRRRRRCVCRG